MDNFKANRKAQPTESRYYAEARRDFWSIQGSRNRIEVIPYFQCVFIFEPRARSTVAPCFNSLIVVLGARKLSSNLLWNQGVRWCDEIVDELDSQSVSDEHLMETAS